MCLVLHRVPRRPLFPNAQVAVYSLRAWKLIFLSLPAITVVVRLRLANHVLLKHPSPQLTRVDSFRRQVNLKHGLALESYSQLHKWSVDEFEAFCRDVWTYCGVVYSVPPQKLSAISRRCGPGRRGSPGPASTMPRTCLLLDWRHTLMQLRSPHAARAGHDGGISHGNSCIARSLNIPAPSRRLD